MKAISVIIIPAQIGFFAVIDYSEDRKVEVGEPVIAWRVETYPVCNSDDVFSVCIPLTVDGDVVSNCIGVQNPDTTVTVFDESTYRSLTELQSARYQ